VSFVMLLDSLTLAIFVPNVGASGFSVTRSSFYPNAKGHFPFPPQYLPFSILSWLLSHCGAPLGGFVSLHE